MKKSAIPLVLVAGIAVFIAAFGSRLFMRIEPGRVGVATLFGKVIVDPYTSGMHVVNPIYNWTIYDCRQRTHHEVASIPSQDQLQTEMDVSVQWRINAEMTPTILQETGEDAQLSTVHLVPYFRSLLREQGKSVKRAEDFFNEETQERMQSNILASMKQYLAPKGIEVDAVLIRDIRLPAFIMKAIESKKEREQEVEQQKAELDRVRLEMEEKVVEAEMQRKAAEEDAEKLRLMADAKAFEIEALNRALAQNPAYIQLRALETLEKMATDPAAKFYFLDSNSPRPLPLMHMGDMMGTPPAVALPAPPAAPAPVERR